MVALSLDISIENALLASHGSWFAHNRQCVRRRQHLAAWPRTLIDLNSSMRLSPPFPHLVLYTRLLQRHSTVQSSTHSVKYEAKAVRREVSLS